LDDAERHGYCLGSFNVFNIETLEGVIEAAVQCKSPVICGIYEPHMKSSDVEVFANLVTEVAHKVHIPVVLHLDHAEDMSSIERAIECGFTSLMFDGPPNISFREKVEKTKRVVEIAHSINVTVESELGRITRVGIDDTVAEENITDPNLVREFVQKTGIDVLAPAIGSISGMGVQDASINLDLLKHIKDNADCYLSLHGGSGVDDTLWKKLIKTGIHKASVYTIISNTAIHRIGALIEKQVPDLAVLMGEVRAVFREMVGNRLEVFGSTNRYT
jgi:fructose-bisphosphate aldolase class II